MKFANAHTQYQLEPEMDWTQRQTHLAYRIMWSFQRCIWLNCDSMRVTNSWSIFCNLLQLVPDLPTWHCSANNVQRGVEVECIHHRTQMVQNQNQNPGQVQAHRAFDLGGSLLFNRPGILHYFLTARSHLQFLLQYTSLFCSLVNSTSCLVLHMVLDCFALHNWVGRFSNVCVRNV